MQSAATTVEQYLESLPAERRGVIEAVRAAILQNLDTDYEEGIQYGMISYHVPHRIFPAGYHCDPTKALPYAGLAAQKNHLSLHLMFVYGSDEQREWFCQAWEKTGKKLDMGKACIRFKTLDDVPLDVIGEAIRRVPAKGYIAHYEALLARPRPSAGSSGATPKTVKKKTAKKNAASAKTAPSVVARKTVTKKAVGKKPVVKTTVVKKSATKKRVAKKSVAKKRRH